MAQPRECSGPLTLAEERGEEAAPVAGAGAMDAAPAANAQPASGAGSAPALSGADRRAAEKEIAAIDRKLAKLAGEIAAQHEKLAAHDQSDYVGLGTLGDALSALEGEVADLELRWLELSELLE